MIIYQAVVDESASKSVVIWNGCNTKCNQRILHASSQILEIDGLGRKNLG
jgi:hypothetical protein